MDSSTKLASSGEDGASIATHDVELAYRWADSVIPHGASGGILARGRQRRSSLEP